MLLKWVRKNYFQNKNNLEKKIMLWHLLNQLLMFLRRSKMNVNKKTEKIFFVFKELKIILLYNFFVRN